ncbi:hypothetical protein AAFF_G00087760 [Aldrovandia affinis]|uniref:Uncharacterized protein n=1 Tax=Aldrovandia affinis TaxID=143900 RepID=A0AAD7WCL5_9TELE|nr:hypothetical protein AAFF_G00087760 [Aldrovandia affinis]
MRTTMKPSRSVSATAAARNRLESLAQIASGGKLMKGETLWQENSGQHQMEGVKVTLKDTASMAIVSVSVIQHRSPGRQRRLFVHPESNNANFTVSINQ